MTDIVSSTGTYQWYYSVASPTWTGTSNPIETISDFWMDFMSLSRHQILDNPYDEIAPYDNTTSPTSRESLIQAIIDAQIYTGFADRSRVDTITTGTDSTPRVVTLQEVFLLATGTTYDTGIVQIYGVRILDSIGNLTGVNEVTVTNITYSGWVYYAPISASPSIPPVPTPPDANLQLRLAGQKFYAEDNSILPKYTSGLSVVRGTFAGGTRTGIIAQANNGGFLIYEEVAGNPSGPVYVYTNERKLKVITDATNIGQYLI